MGFNTSTRSNTKIGKKVLLPTKQVSNESSVDRGEEITNNKCEQLNKTCKCIEFKFNL